ncbi:hypothetical protein HDU76_007092 [Blyttiomyces sp. JEL0837]|nr:hypothetical protein HDU76_007092 [Blyttiomyces sp. JEL0837]
MQGPKPINNTPTALPVDQRGVILRVAQQINEYVESRHGKRDADGNIVECDVRVSYMEIYNEGLSDLLANKAITDDLKIRIDPDSITGKDLYVQGLSTVYVNNIEDYIKILEVGTKNRTVAETNMNEVSSRSHAILTIIVDQYTIKSSSSADSESETLDSSSPSPVLPRATTANVNNGRIMSSQSRKRSKIHLIDLAGSERADTAGTSGIRLKEGSSINQSLLSLANVISALTTPGNGNGNNNNNSTSVNRNHIPYRDSKLTYMLSDSIGGNALTLMIACCTPTAKNYNESLNALRFAERVKKVQNVATLNVDPNMLKIIQLETEIKTLRDIIRRQKEQQQEKQQRQPSTTCTQTDDTIILKHDAETLTISRPIFLHIPKIDFASFKSILQEKSQRTWNKFLRAFMDGKCRVNGMGGNLCRLGRVGVEDVVIDTSKPVANGHGDDGPNGENSNVAGTTVEVENERWTEIRVRWKSLWNVK